MLVKDLIVTGDARIIGNLYTNQDLDNNSSGGSGGSGGLTYRLEKSGSTISLVGSDGSKTSVTDTDTNTTSFLPLSGGTLTGALAAPSITEGGIALSSKYTTQAWVKDYINTALVNGSW